MRHVPLVEPDAPTAEQYLRIWNSGDLYNKRDTFPDITSQSLFGNDNPLELEIGCSTGEYICSLAAANPTHNFVGIEINLKALYIAVQNASERGLQNIIFIKAPAQDTYELIPPDALHAVYMHFPDPSLHPKYRKRKLLTPAFFDKMHSALVDGGLLSFVTDKEELFMEVLPLFEADSRFAKTHTERYLLGFEPPVKSRYQLYWERHKVTIFRFQASNVKPQTQDET
ncbi:MAG: methyltransferase domain-containing protein [Chloroflexota bacterium]